MSSKVGADPDELDRVATRMQEASSKLGFLSRSISEALGVAPWAGPAAELYRQRWAGDDIRLLAEAARFLANNSELLRRNAQEQRDASSGVAGSAAASSGGIDVSTGVLNRLARARTPAQAAAVWASLSESQRAAIIERHPGSIGNLDGIPPSVRVAANRIRIRRDLDALEAQGDTQSARYRTLQRLDAWESTINVITRKPYGQPQVFLYDRSGDGRIAVIDGDLSTAHNVAVYVPGTGASLDHAGGDLDRGRNIYMAAGVGAGTAVVTWIGYDAPAAVLPLQNGQPIAEFPTDNAMLEKFAERGAQQLANSLAGMGLSRETNLTVIGHSYGSAVAVGGAHLYGAVDNIIVVGSPGVGFDHASDVRIDGTFYAMNAARDPVGRFPIFGENPTDPAFGAVRLTTSSVADYLGVNGHSDYFDPNSTPLFNMQTIVRGQPDRAWVHTWTIAERVGDIVSAPGTALDRSLEAIQDATNLSRPADDVIDGLQGVIRAGEGLIEWGIEAQTE